MKVLAAILLLCSTHSALAAWTLDNARSQVSFVSIKAGNAAEVHRFTETSGQITSDGTATLTIQLASVDTLIPIRDERMRETLFETELFPTATVVTPLDMKRLEAIPDGGTLEIASEVILLYRDSEVPYTADLLVSRLSSERVVVATLKPLIVNAGSLGLAPGVEALREVAGLPSISLAVPVSVVLTFSSKP